MLQSHRAIDVEFLLHFLTANTCCFSFGDFGYFEIILEAILKSYTLIRT